MQEVPFISKKKKEILFWAPVNTDFKRSHAYFETFSKLYYLNWKKSKYYFLIRKNYVEE